MPDAKPLCQFTALTRKSQKMPAAEEAHCRSNKECQRLGCSRGHFPPRDHAGEGCKGLLCALPEALRFAFRSRGSVQDAPLCEFPPFLHLLLPDSTLNILLCDPCFTSHDPKTLFSSKDECTSTEWQTSKLSWTHCERCDKDFDPDGNHRSEPRSSVRPSPPSWIAHAAAECSHVHTLELRFPLIPPER